MLPVISDKGKAYLLDYADIIFIRLKSKGQLEIGTKHGTSYPAKSIKDYADALAGTSFETADQNIIVNMDHRKKFDEKSNILHFEPAGADKVDHCEVSRRHRTQIKKYFIFWRR